jgi:hypothetical protein
MARLQQIRSHACAHVSQPDEPNLHGVHHAGYSCVYEVLHDDVPDGQQHRHRGARRRRGRARRG